jgi:hypothetical protein
LPHNSLDHPPLLPRLAYPKRYQRILAAKNAAKIGLNGLGFRISLQLTKENPLNPLLSAALYAAPSIDSSPLQHHSAEKEAKIIRAIGFPMKHPPSPRLPLQRPVSAAARRVRGAHPTKTP